MNDRTKTWAGLAGTLAIGLALGAGAGRMSAPKATAKPATRASYRHIGGGSGSSLVVDDSTGDVYAIDEEDGVRNLGNLRNAKPPPAAK